MAGPGAGYKPSRAGPRIYVYDLPPRFNTWYHPESLNHQLHYAISQRILATGHRTTDGDNADFYFVPVSSGVPPSDPRRLAKAVEYIRDKWPWWDRHGGARHILMATGLRGRSELLGLLPELAPTTENVTFLSMWGHSKEHPVWGPPSHRPGLDIVLPAPAAFSLPDPMASPLNPRVAPVKRSLMLSFNGPICGPGFFEGSCTELDDRKFNSTSFPYSSGVRQKVFRWFRKRPRFRIRSNNAKLQPDMASSRYCLAPPGWGFGERGAMAVLMGCLPVTAGDGVYQAFEPELDWSKFSVHIPEGDLPLLPEVLRNVTRRRRQAMQAKLHCAARHLHWSTSYGGLFGERGAYDAFETIMAILRSRLRFPGALAEHQLQLDPALERFMGCNAGPDDALAQRFGAPLCSLDRGSFTASAPTPPCSTFGWFGIAGGAACQTTPRVQDCPRPRERAARLAGDGRRRKHARHAASEDPALDMHQLVKQMLKQAQERREKNAG